MKGKYILSIDAGTTGITAILFDHLAGIVAKAYREFKQYFPQPGWVEHNPEEIWQTCLQTISDIFVDKGVSLRDICAIGITNQRETTVLWERTTGAPVHNAIVWQCRRTAELCGQLKAKRGLEKTVREKTGLVIDAYFSGTKIKWLLDNIPGVKEKAIKGEIVFGTIDSWLIFKLTGGKVHITDYTNASRTMLFNIHELRWDEELLKGLEVPAKMLPEVKSSSEVYGYTAQQNCLEAGIPIAGIAGDQQAALFGQTCFSAGEVKNTYGTGCFLIYNTGKRAITSTPGLLTTLACDRQGKPCYALEGSIFMAGAAVQWLRDGLKIITGAGETGQIAGRLKSNEGVYLVPAFTGLGAPYWDANARGAILGITRGTSREHIVRATLEAIAYQTKDVLEVMNEAAGIKIQKLRVDGGAAKNNFLMQFQADILGIPVERPVVTETTALGAAWLAGLAVGFWKDAGELQSGWRRETVFEPKVSQGQRDKLYQGWKEAVKRVLTQRADVRCQIAVF